MGPAAIEWRAGAAGAVKRERSWRSKRWSVKSLFAMIGPGVVTGAADDDPSGIATYSQGGAQFGYALGWTMFLTTPFMIAIQLVSARIGAVTGQGLAANLGKAMPAVLLYGLVGLLLIANTLNIAADIAAMGDALRLVGGGPILLYIAAFGIGCLTAEILIPYHFYSRYLKALTLVLFAYVATAFTIRIPWGDVAAATFLPRVSWNRDYMLMLVAIFGTTISPYMFFWQASLEAEERKLRAKTTSNTAASTTKRLGQREGFRIGIDTTAGMVLSNIIGFFIIVTTAATLHAHGKTHIDTAAQAAEALRPLAGPLAFFCSPWASSAPGCSPCRCSPVLPAMRWRRLLAGKAVSKCRPAARRVSTSSSPQRRWPDWARRSPRSIRSGCCSGAPWSTASSPCR